jgi:hypothetical protein
VTNSFTPETRVLLADGTTKPIKDIRDGDQVLSTDENTDTSEPETVTAQITGTGTKHLVKITLTTDTTAAPTTSSVTATDGHPFWVPALHEWINATDLHAGQWLRTAAGTQVQITAVTRWTQHATVHNLTVSDLHTYYVLAGATPVLVHNSNCPLYTVGGPRVRPGKDIDVDADGFVNGPTAEQLKSLDVQGLSTFDSVENASRIGLKGQVRTPTGPLPDGLGVIADGRGVGGPRALGHHTIYPTRRMSFDEYVGLIQGMNWQNIGKKL